MYIYKIYLNNLSLIIISEVIRIFFKKRKKKIKKKKMNFLFLGKPLIGDYFTLLCLYILLIVSTLFF